MELVTKSLRPGMPCELDIFYEENSGFSENINDTTTYKLVLIVAGSDVPSFTVTSGDLKDGRWDPKITNTKFRENLSPDLKWEKVEGASRYAVFMIDGEWLHMDVFTTETALAEGAFAKGERGAQYVGPYPPWGTHTYSVFVFALKGEPGEVEFQFDAGGNDINKIYAALNVDKDGNAGNVVAYGRLDGNYTHQN